MTRQVGLIERSEAAGRPYLYAGVDEFLRPGDEIGAACVERDCPDYGDPDFGEGTCPAGHAGMVIVTNRHRP